MKTNDFNFDLPLELIAQQPMLDRKKSRMMVLDKKNNTIEHKHFYDIVDYLNFGDVLVRNNTKVIPARIFGRKEITNAKIECLLLKQKSTFWECLIGNAKVVKLDTILIFSDQLKGKCIGVKDEGIRLIEFEYDGVFLEILEELGKVPLPPYIKQTLMDNDRYQTVYAKYVGSSAAPTAGFHFDDFIIQKLKQKGVEIVDVTLHIGLGTFRPVKVDNILDHKMHSEEFIMTKESADKLNAAKKENRKIIAVGTTTTRVLETVFNKYGFFKETHEESNIFIYPGYKFVAIDSLITNFHLPKSTLIMLVSALAGKDFVFEAYQLAVKEKYRFFSFGDSMLIKDI